MHELSLHILDLMENAVRAGATVVRITVYEDARGDVLEVSIDDNGPGLPVPPERATDPFFTTGEKRVGLGLSLFGAAAEEAGGRCYVGPSELGGTSVQAVMKLHHVDRKPLGDLASSLLAIACTHPEVDVQCVVERPEGSRIFSSASTGNGGENAIVKARRFAEDVRRAAAVLLA